MALEYVAQDGVASLRHTTLPATLGSAVISRGLEDHASYSTHGARLATVCVSALRTVLATELVAAVRAIEMGAAMPDGLPLSNSLRSAYAQATEVLDERREDRSLSADLAAAEALLPRLGHTHASR
jgi:histidine ammonia-lyase